MRNCDRASWVKNGRSLTWAVREQFEIFSWKQTWWSDDKTIIELGYRKMSWFVSASIADQLFVSAE